MRAQPYTSRRRQGLLDMDLLRSSATSRGQTAVILSDVVCNLLTQVVQLLLTLIVGIAVVSLATERSERLFRLLRLIFD